MPSSYVWEWGCGEIISFYWFFLPSFFLFLNLLTAISRLALKIKRIIFHNELWPDRLYGARSRSRAFTLLVFQARYLLETLWYFLNGLGMSLSNRTQTIYNWLDSKGQVSLENWNGLARIRSEPFLLSSYWLELSCWNTQQRESQRRNWFGQIGDVWRFWMIPNWF